jgi:hypothetical protein
LRPQDRTHLAFYQAARAEWWISARTARIPILGGVPEQLHGKASEAWRSTPRCGPSATPWRWGRDFQLHGPVEDTSFRVKDYTIKGLPLIAYVIMEDGGMQVEVIRDAAGAVVAARMCATNDVDEVAGVWRNAGELDIASGRCLAADPYCSAKDAYRFEFDVSPGRYVAEVFDWTGDDGGHDCLALRILKQG